MPIKCVTEAAKDTIVQLYSVRKVEQKDIAFYLGTSARTVNRVLNERGVLTAVPQLKADAYNVMQVLKKHGINASKLDMILSHVKEGTSQENVADYLYSAKREEITELFYTAMMNRALDSQMALSFPVLIDDKETVTDDLPF